MKLNDKQYEAVVTTEGPLLIIAGAGSGKTRTLVERVVYLLTQKNVDPQKIILATFTEKAGRELVTRISKRLKEDNFKININDMYIGTLHSIFLRLIEENIEHSLFRQGYRVLDETDQHFFVFTKIKRFSEIAGYREFFASIPANTNWGRSGKLARWFDKINEDGKNLSNIKSEDERINFLKEAHRLYFELLVEENFLDFATIQRELFRMLHDEEVLSRIQEKFDYIMIDEYQDTNIIQEKIIFMLGWRTKNICVVGDDDQGIYRFRGATVKNILNFSNRFEEGVCKKVVLDTNYRSHRDIIRFSNKWINLINWRGYRFEKQSVPPEDKEFGDYSGVIRVGGETEKIWKDNIYKFIKKLHSSGKIKDYSQMAFLFRSVQSPNVKELKSYLEKNGIKIYSPRSKFFFEREEIKLVIGALLVYFPQSKNLVFEVSRISGSKIYSYYKECLNLLKKQVSQDEKFYLWLVSKRKENISQEKGTIPSLRKIFYSLFEFDTFRRYLDNESVELIENRECFNLGIFSDILEKFENISRIEDIEKEDVEKVVRYFFTVYLKNLHYKRLSEYENKDEFPKGAIPFLTFHQAKGLEFLVTVVGSLESTPVEREKTEEDILEEYLKIGDNFEPQEKKEEFDFWRIYYTAYTRAQNLLVLTSIENGSGKNTLPSRVFKPLYESLTRGNDENFNLKNLPVEDLKIEEKKRVMTFTGDVELYENCPRRYKFVKEFKFRPLNDPATFFGTFAHLVIERVHREVVSGEYNKKNLVEIEKNLVEIVEEIKLSLEKNLRTKFSDQEVDDIIKNTRRYMESSILKDILGVEMKLSRVEDDFIMGGTLDLVKKEGENLRIIDFKTGRYTKEKLKNYKRQLEIYSYLLQEKKEDEKRIKTALYFVNEDNPYIELELEKESILKTVEDFREIVKKIEKKEFPPRDFDNLCESCEFRWYCLKNLK